METAGIYLEIISPDVPRPGMTAEKVVLPGAGGRFTILKGHAPLISALTEGDIEYTVGGKTERLHIRSGFVEVSDNRVSVCAEI